LEQITLGTAGHIDHGKSSLVLALTGTNPDRLAAEKQRGMTLDLGFAHLELPNQRQVSFVDVPGHEALVGQMLAGAQGFSGVLFVVAADEGLMPQSLEHLQLCELLGVTQAVVVITKADLVEPDLLEWLKLELLEFFSTRSFAAAPVVAVSTKTGEGLDQLKEQINQLFFPVPAAQGDFRMPIDRSFSVKGFGTVVSGSVVSGVAHKDDLLWLYPEQQPLKVRGFQSNALEAESLIQGMRGAVNLPGLSVDQVNRGKQLASPGSLVNTQKIGVMLEVIPQMKRLLKARKPLKVYGQTGFSIGRLVPLSESQGEETAVYWLLQLDRPVSLRYGDRLVLRGGSPEQSLGGARVLALHGPLSRRDRKQGLEGLQQLHQGTLGQRIVQVLRFAGSQGAGKDSLGPLVGGSAKDIAKALTLLLAQQGLIEVDHKGHHLLHPTSMSSWGAFLCRCLRVAHQNHPEDLGVKVEYLVGKTQTRLSRASLMGVLGWSIKQNLLAKTGKFYHLKDFKGGLSPAHQKLAAQISDELSRTAPGCPGLNSLAVSLGESKEEVFGVLKSLQSQGQVVQVAADLFYRIHDIHEIQSRLQACLLEQGTITVIQFKELLGLARKPAISLLEHFDQQGITARDGDVRSGLNEAKQ